MTRDARRRLLDEGRIPANLRHAHLVQVLAVGETVAWLARRVGDTCEGGRKPTMGTVTPWDS